jgi:uncharacterized membrane protein YeaQ/YmgE (transglycosylase-associated protein family)
MTFLMFVTWVLVGVLAGVLADRVTKRGGLGLRMDVILGLVGSIGGSLLVRSLLYSGTDMITMTSLACLGAVIPLAVQRKFWPTAPLEQRKVPKW